MIYCDNCEISLCQQCMSSSHQLKMFQAHKRRQIGVAAGGCVRSGARGDSGSGGGQPVGANVCLANLPSALSKDDIEEVCAQWGGKVTP